MQALAERLFSWAGNGVLRSAVPFSFTGLKTVQPLPDFLLGRTLTSASHRGKYLLLDFAGPRIAVHLSQGGRVDLERPAKTTRPKGALTRFVLDHDTDTVGILIKEFGTERKAGWWVLAEGDNGPMNVLGPDPYDEGFADLILRGKDARRVHTLLRDQRTVAGIGRGYSDDILHDAQISPTASLDSLDDAQRARLLASVRAMLDAGLAVERKRKGGLPAKVGDHWVVHHRHGERCPRCGEDLRRVSYEAYEITYCPLCQTGGQILADRRMSRLLK